MEVIHNGHEKISKIVRRRVRNDNDAFIVITGKSGLGKTALSYHIGKGADKNLTLDKNFIVSPNLDNIMKKIRSIKRYECAVLDEAIKILFKQEWYTQAQKLLKKMYNVNRAENKITIANIPKFTDLSSSFRNEKVFLWIHIYARGKGVAMYPSDNQFKADPWDLKKNDRLMDSYDNMKTINESWSSYLNKIRKTKSFAFAFTFPDFPPDVKEQYLTEYKFKFMYEDIDDPTETDQRMVDRDKLIYLVSKLGVSSPKLSKYISLSDGRIRDIVAGNDYDITYIIKIILNNLPAKKKVEVPS